MVTKKFGKRLLSLILSLAMVVSFTPLPIVIEASADTGDAVTGSDALAALGIDTGVAPEGFNPDSIENPYGRDTVEVTSVKELYTIGLEKELSSEPTCAEETQYSDSQMGQTKVTRDKTDDNRLVSNLYGHEKWNEDTTEGILGAGSTATDIAAGKTTVTGEYALINHGDHEQKEKYKVLGYYTGTKNQTTDLGDNFSFAMSNVAAGNFDGNKKSHETQVAMVYTSELSKNGGLYLRFGDSMGTYGDHAIELLPKSKEIGNPTLKLKGENSTSSLFVEDFALNPYQMKNYLQVATGDWNGDGTDEVAVYIPEVGNSRIVVYSLQTTSNDDPGTAYKDSSKWKLVWTYYLREGSVVSNMVHFTGGDVDRDGIDDLACTWGYYYGPEQNIGSRAVVMFGGKGAGMLKRSQEFPLSYGTSNIVRAAFVFGDIDGKGSKSLVLCGQSDADIKAGNIYSRYVALYNWDGTKFESSLQQNFNLFEKDGNGKYIWEIMDPKHRPEADYEANKFYSLPLCVSNAAIIRKGISEKGGDLLYFDSLIISYGETGLSLKEAWDRSSTLTGEAKTEYVEYGALAGDLTGKTGASALGTVVQTLPSKTEKSVKYTEKGDHKEPEWEAKIFFLNWLLEALGVKDEVLRIAGWKDVTGAKEYEVKYNVTVPGRTNYVVIDRAVNSGSGYYTKREKVNSSFAMCLANTDDDSSYLNYTGKHYYTYTDPMVLTVLASPPYFKDLLGRGDLSGAYAESKTSYSKTEGSGSGSVGHATITLGAYISVEANITVFGFPIAKVESATEYTAGFTWDTEKNSTLEQTISYNAGAGEDKVAFYSIPMEIYEFMSYVPDGSGGYKKVLTTVNIPHEASVKLLNLSEYEDIAKDYSVLPKISNSVLKHKIGDPASYPASPADTGYELVAEYKGEPSSVGYTSKAGGDSIGQEISMTKENKNTYSGFAGVQTRVGGGVAGASVGVIAGFDGGGGSVHISTEGSSFSGEMQHMPEEARPYGYGMNWRIFSYKYKDGDTSFPVVSYAVSDVSQPSPLPEDFGQDIANTTSDSVTLNWTYDKFVSGFQLYRYYEFPDGSGSYKLDFVPFSSGVKNEEDGTYSFSFIDKNLSPYTEYSYQIQTVNANNIKNTSIYSKPLVCRTKTDVGYPEISLSGLNANGDLVIYPDSVGKVVIDVKDKDKYKSLIYQWQKLDNGSWKNIVGAKTNEYVIRNANAGDDGRYRCLVNVIYYDETAAQNYYISAYSKEFGTAYSKRRPAANLTVAAHNYGEGAGQSRGIHSEIELYSANVGNATAPHGTVNFIVKGADYQYSKMVKLIKSSGTKNFGGESKYYSTATLDIVSLPNGVYTIEYYYSGDRVFKDANSDGGKMIVLGEGLTGYTLSTVDSAGVKKASFTYGDGIVPKLYQISSGSTTPVEVEGVSYKLKSDDTEKDFDHNEKLSVGSYVLKALVSGDEVAETKFTVVKKPITVFAEDRDNVKNQEVSNCPPVVNCKELTFEELAAMRFGYKIYNSASSEVTLKDGMDPGNYTVTPRAKTEDPELNKIYKNYDMNFVSGKYTVVGMSYSLEVESENYTDASGSRKVGEALINTGSEPTAAGNFSKGEIVQLVAKPFTGYEVEKWVVVVSGIEPKTYIGSDLPNSNLLTLNMEAAATKVNVYFKPKSITLGVTADRGGRVTCTDEYFASGAKVSSGSEFEFIAEPDEGYHFKEWQYNELGSGIKYLEGTKLEEGKNSLLIKVGLNSITAKAVFERDSYQLDLVGNITAYYMKPAEIEGDEPIKTFITSGTSLPGDTVITVIPKTGYSAAEGAIFKVNGSDTESGESYTFTMKENTKVELETVREKLSITTEAENGSIIVKIDGKPAEASELKSVEGGSNVKFIARADRGYHFVKWIVDDEESTETTEILNVVELGKSMSVKAVFEESERFKARAEATPKTRGTMYFTLYDRYGDIAIDNEEMPEEGVDIYKDESISITVKPKSGSMVEQWSLGSEKFVTGSKTFPGGEDGKIKVVDGDIEVGVVLVASTKYMFYFLPADDNGSLSVTADGEAISSGQEVAGGSTVELTATPNADYMVDYWTISDGDLGADENTEGVVDSNGRQVVDPVYIIDGLRGYKTLRVHFKALSKHTVTVENDEVGEGTIEFATAIQPGDDTSPSSERAEVRDGAKVVIKLKTKDIYHYSDQAALEEKVRKQLGDEADVEAKVDDDDYTITVYDLTENLTFIPKDIFKERVKPEISAEDITVTYTGQAVEASEIKGVATVEGSAVAGNWSFAEDSYDLTNANGEGITVKVKFIPEDAKYAPGHCEIKVTINKATPGGTPSYKAIKEAGKTLADAELAVGSIEPAKGEIKWELDPDTAVEQGKAYNWIFIPNDEKNYECLKGSIVVYETTSSGGGSTGNDSGGSTGDNSGGSTGNDSGGGSSSSDSPSGGGSSSTSENSAAKDNGTVTVSVGNDADSPVAALIIVKSNKGKDHAAEAEISEKTLENAFKRVKEEAKKNGKEANGISLEIKVEMPKGTDKVKVSMSKDILSKIASKEVKNLILSSPLETTVLNQKAVMELKKQSKGDIVLSTSPVTSLSDEAKKKIGERPVYDLSIIDAKEKKSITNFGEGEIKIIIPYSLMKNETADGLCAVYVDEEGKTHNIAKSTYDPKTGSMIFTTNHLSVYGIGYTAPTEQFSDIETHWAKDAVNYVAVRGLITGTEGNFSPNAPMSREMLVAALARLSGVDEKDYKTNSFSDVKEDSVYRPYIEWAYSRGVIYGVGDGKFEPERAVTRQEIAVIFERYTKATGDVLPVVREASIYADEASIGDAYKAAVTMMQKAGVMTGIDGNRFNPKGSATKAELSSILSRYIKLSIEP